MAVQKTSIFGEAALHINQPAYFMEKHEIYLYLENYSTHKQQCLKIDTLLRILMFFSLLAPTGNNERTSFLVHQVLRTSCGIAECLRSFPSAFEHPNIAVVQ